MKPRRRNSMAPCGLASTCNRWWTRRGNVRLGELGHHHQGNDAGRPNEKNGYFTTKRMHSNQQELETGFFNIQISSKMANMSIFAASFPIWRVKSLNDTALGKFRGWGRMPGRYQGYFCGVLCTWALGFRCQGMPLVWKEMLREDHGICHPVYQRVGSPKDESIFKLHGH